MTKEFLLPPRFEPWSPGHEADFKPMCYYATLNFKKCVKQVFEFPESLFYLSKLLSSLM